MLWQQAIKKSCNTHPCPSPAPGSIKSPSLQPGQTTPTMGGSHTRLFLLAAATLLLAGHTEGNGDGCLLPELPGPPGCKGLASPNATCGELCVFPFISNGMTHTGCTYHKSDLPWCATAVNSTTGVMVPNRSLLILVYF
jgi:hypothetical protein